MSYAICHVVCGYEVPYAVREFIERIEEEFEHAGFDTFYSGNGPTPACCGVQIGQFDECSNIKASELIRRLTASEDQIIEARQKMESTKEIFVEFLEENKDKMTDEDKAELYDSLPANPEVVLVWGKSQ